MNCITNKPIFVIGTGRSGSTVFFDILAKHPNVVWLSSLARNYPRHPVLNSLLMHLRSLSLMDRILGGRFAPSEAYPFWDLNCPGFSNPYRDLRGEDVTPAAAVRIREAFGRMGTPTRHRVVAKITGWPRVRYLREIFPGALFIEVQREPCATASSLLEVAFWDGWRAAPGWRRGPLPPDLDALWRQENESFVALAAIEYVIVQRALADCRTALPSDQMHAVSYSRLCADPVGVFRDVTKFCGLDWSARFEKSIRRVRLMNRDDKWRSDLTAHQQAVLQRTLEQAQALKNSRTC